MATFKKVTTKAGVSWRFQINVQGHRESGTRTTKAEAVAWCAEREASLRRDAIAGVQADRTVDETFRRYGKDVSAHKAGAKWEIDRLDAIGRVLIDGAAIKDMKLAAVTPDILGKYRDYRLTVDKVKGSTVSREFNLLSHVFSTAVTEWKWIATSPTTKVRRPKESESRERLPTDDEIKRICLALGFDLGGNETATETKSQAVAVMFLFAIETAMRSGEMCQLEPAFVKGSVAHLPAKITKMRRRRDVPLSKRALALLATLPPAEPGGTIFGIDTESRDALFRKAKGRARVEGLTFHDSRHLAATRLSKKLDVLALARMGGWHDLRQLQVYYNESAADMAPRLG
jgi:integrase